MLSLKLSLVFVCIHQNMKLVRYILLTVCILHETIQNDNIKHNCCLVCWLLKEVFVYFDAKEIQTTSGEKCLLELK